MVSTVTWSQLNTVIVVAGDVSNDILFGFSSELSGAGSLFLSTMQPAKLIPPYTSRQQGQYNHGALDAIY
jgi:hypothetical protein